VPKVIGYVSVNWNIQSNTDIFLLYTYMAICFLIFFLDLLDLDEEAGMIQKSTNQTDQNEDAKEQVNGNSKGKADKTLVSFLIVILGFWFLLSEWKCWCMHN